jgi:hypothetical protein
MKVKVYVKDKDPRVIDVEGNAKTFYDACSEIMKKGIYYQKLSGETPQLFYFPPASIDKIAESK